MPPSPDTLQVWAAPLAIPANRIGGRRHIAMKPTEPVSLADRAGPILPLPVCGSGHSRAVGSWCFAAINLVLTPDGRYVFLEINPSGQ